MDTRERGALRKDDRLDALAGAVAYWVEAMARDQEEAHEQHKTKMLEKELERFRDHVLGGTKEADRWMDA